MTDKNIHSELLMMLLGRDILSDISQSDDYLDALRKALLFMVFLGEENQSPSVRMFVKELLSSFPALKEGLKDGRHPITGSHNFSVVRDKSDKLLVTVNRTLVEEYQKKIDGDGDGDLTRLLPKKDIYALANYFKEKGAEWNIVSKRHVAFFDFMGFKNVVESYENRYGEFHEILSKIVEAAKRTEGMHVKRDKADKHGFTMTHEDEGAGQLRFIQFSDSIMVFSNDDSPESATALELAAQVIFLNALFEGLLLRGALATGEVVADFERNIFFGQAIIDAYLLEEQQQWYGVAYHQNFDFENKSKPASDDIQDKTDGDIPISTHVKVPLKSSIPGEKTIWREMEALNWPLMAKHMSDITALLAPFEYPENEKLNYYYRNTMAFVKESLEMN